MWPPPIRPSLRALQDERLSSLKCGPLLRRKRWLTPPDVRSREPNATRISRRCSVAPSTAGSAGGIAQPGHSVRTHSVRISAHQITLRGFVGLGGNRERGPLLAAALPVEFLVRVSRTRCSGESFGGLGPTFRGAQHRATMRLSYGKGQRALSD